VSAALERPPGPDPDERRLRVGFLHVGRERSGVRRYGRILADAASRDPGLAVSESDAGERDAPIGALRRAARRLRESDVVHVQWKLADWGPRTGGLPRTEVVRFSLEAPMVVTLHDVFTRQGVRERWLDAGALGLRRLGMVAAGIVVHSEEERRRVDGMVPADRVHVVPHFVEERTQLPERAAARGTLGVEDRRVITLLGYVTKRRGHRLVLDALAGLPDDVTCLFVGSVIDGRVHVAEELREHARAIGVEGRVRFMGYVQDAELDAVLAATDVALCPFREMSASGALATWISAGRPIVASDLPAIRELDALVPGAIRRFSPYEPAALREAITAALDEATLEADPRVRRLATELATPRIVARYAEVYRAAAR
jgi:glycosyltransferase involved in cell wall biosynthesis